MRDKKLFGQLYSFELWLELILDVIFEVYPNNLKDRVDVVILQVKLLGASFAMEFALWAF